MSFASTFTCGMASPASATSIVASFGGDAADAEADVEGEADVDSDALDAEAEAEAEAAVRSSPGGAPGFEHASRPSDNDNTTRRRTPLNRPNRSPPPTSARAALPC
jgi:hypothetical protein